MEIARESIFVSALRGFCKVFFSAIGLFFAIFVAMIFYSLFSSPYGFEEKTTLNVLPGLNNEINLQPLNCPVVLQVNIKGIVGEPQKLDTQTIESILVDSRRAILSKDRVKALLLYINTPGGTVIDSDNIYRMLKEYKELYKVPVFGYIDGMCASGGMYISSAVDKLYASPSSIVGSVGVILGPFFNLSEAMSKVGIQSKTLTQGLDKDAMSPFRPWRPDEDASIVTTMKFFYERFVNIVTAARTRLDKNLLVQSYGAKIFDVEQAESLGYIDVANADYKTTLAALMQEANIDPKAPYQIVELAPKKDWLTPFVNGHSPIFTGKIEHVINLGDKRSFMAKDQFAYLYEPGIVR